MLGEESTFGITAEPPDPRELAAGAWSRCTTRAATRSASCSWRSPAFVKVNFACTGNSWDSPRNTGRPGAAPFGAR
ncbi:hypothetical protein PN441_05115 [Spirulina major CS-329]|uniref:hypothetical protein n=1 Tax=Spirulina TaxID=1154 RepID=UPI00232BDE34|nr:MULTISPECIES: hypothetical protein [Spirulina]MDB9496265.1 hypothetical protein [Spirulina subsalsa CS-330]MDB9502444.1 hypothetical protein [Spirulina major CS-329]